MVFVCPAQDFVGNALPLCDRGSMPGHCMIPSLSLCPVADGGLENNFPRTFGISLNIFAGEASEDMWLFGLLNARAGYAACTLRIRFVGWLLTDFCLGCLVGAGVE